MSRSKDRARAKTYRYRNGVRIPADMVDKELQTKKQAETDQALQKLGLVRSKPKILIPRRAKV